MQCRLQTAPRRLFSPKPVRRMDRGKPRARGCPAIFLRWRQCCRNIGRRLGLRRRATSSTSIARLPRRAGWRRAAGRSPSSDSRRLAGRVRDLLPLQRVKQKADTFCRAAHESTVTASPTPLTFFPGSSRSGMMNRESFSPLPSPARCRGHPGHAGRRAWHRGK